MASPRGLPLSISPAGLVGRDSPRVASPLAKGQCRAILVAPEVRGQRCACAGFSINNATPGAACECGHQSCYHSSEQARPAYGQDELDQLKQRMQSLEEMLRGQPSTAESVRLATLERRMDKAVDDFQSELRGSYRNSGAAWKFAEQLQSRVTTLEGEAQRHSQRLDHSFSNLAELRDRHLELWDHSEGLEEKLDKVMSADRVSLTLPDAEQTLQASVGLGTPPPTNPATTAPIAEPRQLPVPPAMRLPSPSIEIVHPGIANIWTVHVCMMLSRQQLHPFQKDTTAYLRCLSRGLYRTVAIQGHDGRSFTSAITEAFRGVIHHASWEVLSASPEVSQFNHGRLRLRPLEPRLAREDHTLEALKDHGVIDRAGRLECIYVAPSQGVLTWNLVQAGTTYVEGLEHCWQPDKRMDHDEGLGVASEGNDKSTTPRTRVMDTPNPAGSSLKRRASQMTGCGRHGALANAGEDVDRPASKIQRPCKADLVGLDRPIESTT